MAGEDWRDLIVGDRMRVDREFAPRVREAGLSTREWGLIMTAVEFEVEGEGEGARLVADTSDVAHVLPEIRGSDPVPGMPGGDRGRGGSSGGPLDAIRSLLGVGSGPDDELGETAADLADEYAAALQARLEEEGKWERVREAAQPSPE